MTTLKDIREELERTYPSKKICIKTTIFCAEINMDQVKDSPTALKCLELAERWLDTPEEERSDIEDQALTFARISIMIHCDPRAWTSVIAWSVCGYHGDSAHKASFAAANVNDASNSYDYSKILTYIKTLKEQENDNA